MTYYTTLLRQSEGYAARVFEELFKVQSQRRSAARFLADVIRRGGASTSAWSVTLDPGSVRVNVGSVRLFSLSREGVWFCTVGPKLARAPAWLHDTSRGPIVYPKSVKVPSRQYQVAGESVRLIPPQLRAASLEYVEQAALRRRGRSVWERSHSPGVLRFLESFLGIELPRPAQSTGADNDDLQGDMGMPEFAEGSVRRVMVNAYERNPAARAACIQHYGASCAVCGFDFASTYGSFAAGFIHVHHTRPLSQIGREYQVDPVEDLRPVCPNCHAAIHIGGVTRSIEELSDAVAERQRLDL
jgi:5-methylcytosine-specific restriction protein A